MRIRKNANLSSLMFSQASGPSEVLQTHVCLLNQSPWDVIPFSQEPFPSSLHQYEGEDSFNGNGSLGDSIGAVESSVASLMENSEEKPAVKMKEDNMILDDNYDAEDIGEKNRLLDTEEDDEFKLKKGEIFFCCNNISNGESKSCRHCKNEPKEGQSMCDNHFTWPKSYGSNKNRGFKKPEKGSSLGGGGRRGGRGKAAKKGSSSSTSNPYEFYYYSGFGPSWGKRRGGDNKAGEGNNTFNISAITTPQNVTPFPPKCSPIHHVEEEEEEEEFDFLEEDDDDEDDSENADSGKKRMRKPVKERSLKSLM